MKTSLSLLGVAFGALTSSTAAVRTCNRTSTPQVLSGAYTTNTTIMTIPACQQLCLDRDCVGFAFTAPSSCTVFSSISASLNTTDAVSSWRCGAQTPQISGQISGFNIASVFIPASGPRTCVELEGSLVMGGATSIASADNAAVCQERCMATDCAGFTFQGSICTVADWIGLTTAGANGRAWRCRRQLPQEYGNYDGLTIATTVAGDADKCSYKCDANTDCWAYTWTTANSGTCFLKSDKPSTVSAPYDGSAVSGEAFKCSAPQFDVDVEGTDLRQVQRSVWSDCCGECRRTPGCDAYSWSNANGGTCWLKTKSVRSKTKSARGFVTGYMPPSPQASCVKQNRTVLGSSQTLTIPTATRAECERLCLYRNCVGYKWATTSCRILDWIKENFPRDGPIETWRCRAQLVLEYGDYPGLDLANVPAVDATSCSYACEGTAGCYAFTWSNWNGGMCYMKTNKPSAVVGPLDGSLVSGEAWKCLAPRYDTDITGGDIGSVQRTSFQDCCGVCRRTTGCKASSWTDFNGGTCWLKGGSSSVAKSPGVIMVELI